MNEGKLESKGEELVNYKITVLKYIPTFPFFPLPIGSTTWKKQNKTKPQNTKNEKKTVPLEKDSKTPLNSLF